MKVLQLCLGSAAIIVAYSSQAIAGGPDLGNWMIIDSGESCPTGYTCGVVLTNTDLTGSGFSQRMVPDTSSGNTYFQTIITEGGGSSEATVPAPSDSSSLKLSCSEGYTCGDTITGPGFLQQEFTDGTNIWFKTFFTDTLSLSTLAALDGPTPLHLFHTQTDLTLKSGQHLIASTDYNLANQVANLHLDRSKLVADPKYLELDNHEIYHKIVDAEITGATTGAAVSLVAQLSAPLNVLSGYAVQMRVLTTLGWSDFVFDANNNLSVAEKLDNGYCPDHNTYFYRTAVGFDGVECLKITVQDGGPNDGDGSANGTVAVTIGPVLKSAETAVSSESSYGYTLPTETTTESSARSRSGTGAWSWWMMLALLTRFGRVRHSPTPSV